MGIVFWSRSVYVEDSDSQVGDSFAELPALKSVKNVHSLVVFSSSSAKCSSETSIPSSEREKSKQSVKMSDDEQLESNSMSLPVLPNILQEASRSPSVGANNLPTLSKEYVALRSTTVDATAHDLMKIYEGGAHMSALPSSGKTSLQDLFEHRKEAFKEAELLIVVESLKLAETDSIIAKGEKLKVLDWVSDSEIRVQSETTEDEHTINLLPNTIGFLQPYGHSKDICSFEMFTLAELLDSIDVRLRQALVDDNVVEVVKDFIQLRPRYFQEHQQVGGIIPLFPISRVNECVVQNDDAYEMKHVHLYRDGEIKCDVDPNFSEQLNIATLSNWAFVKFRGQWKVVLMTDDKEIKHILDFYEVFSDPSRDVLLPSDSIFQDLPSYNPSLRMLNSSDLVV